MSTELSNGVIIPEEYSDDWYDEMSINLRKLNDVITAASDNATDIQRLDADKANQSDLTALTSRVSQNETDIIALQTAVSGALKREIVQTLPTEDISTTTIYMIRNSQSSGTNIYDEYMYINSQWELIGTSATDFSNYYTKNETDNLLSAKANQTDLTSLSGRVTQNETDITALQTAVSGALKREIVQSLPTQDISTTTIYMIRNTTTSGDNIYDEYMYINNLWELIGTSATDFSNYYTKTEIDTLLSGKADDNSVVHTNRNDDVSIPLNSTSAELGVRGGSTNITFLDKNDKKLSGLTLGNYGNSKLSYARLNIFDKDTDNNEIQDTLEYAYVSNNNNAYLRVDRDNFCSLGTNSFRWKSVYATNYYYGSNNIEFSTKFVTTDTAQTISESKTFANTIKSQKEIEFIGSRLAYILPEFYAGYSGLSLCTYGSNGAVRIGIWKVDDNDNTKHVLNDSLGYLNVSTGSVNSVNIVYLTPKNASKAKLGDPVNKWHEINGVEPSSLFLPSDRSARVDISSYFTNLGSGDTNSYSVSANGYIYMQLKDIATVHCFDFESLSATVADYIQTFSRGNDGQLYVLFPVKKGHVFKSTWYTNSTVTISGAYFIPCQGNI